MEETKEVFKILSKQDAIEFKKLGSGRKFCKHGESIADICDEEIERYNYEKSTNIFVKIFKANKFKKDVFALETRTSSCIRNLSAKCIRESKSINKQEIVDKVKKIILDKVNEYEENEKEKKVIDINIKEKKEA